MTIHTSMNGQDFGAQVNGRHVSVYENQSGNLKQVGSFTMKEEPGSGALGSFGFLTLPGCSMPIVYNNASEHKASAAYGNDGQGNYQAYKASSGQYNMAPIGGDGSGLGSEAVRPDGNGRLMYFEPGGAKNYFDSCASQSPDVLNWAGNN